MNDTRIGWIGLGNMGTLMSQRLIKAAYPVTVYNRSKEKEHALLSLGAASALYPSALMQESDVIVVMVADDEATRDIFTGENGLLRARAAGKIIINTSTVSPGVSRDLAAFCEQYGNYYLDAPVSGSTKQAEQGELVIMAGGEEAVFQKVKPVLEHLGKLVLRVGDIGSGNNAKLAMNILLGFITLGLAESVAFAQRNGVNTTDLTTMINNSAMSSPFIKIKGDAIIHGNYKAEFALHHIAKDLRLVRESGMHTPLVELAFRTFLEAEPLLGNEDIIAIVKFNQRLNES